MKKLNSAILLGLVLAVSAPALAATVLWYDFEDGTPGTLMMPGTAAAVASADLSGNGYDMWVWASATQNNSPTASALDDSPTGYGISARYPTANKDGYTTDATINAWSPLAWTIEASMKFDNLNGWQTVIGRSGSSLSVSEADFYLQKNDINDSMRLNIGTVGAERFILDANFSVVAGQWYHMAVVSDGTTVTMYMDKLDGNGYQNVGSASFTGTGGNSLAQGGFVWTFGRGWYGGSNGDFMVGNIDDVRFSDTALTPDQFLHSLYDLGSPAPGHRSIDASRSPTLSWEFVNPGITADSYEIYGPTLDPNVVDPNYTGAPTYTTTSQSQAVTGPLAFSRTYLWRVDTVVGENTFAGPIWQFVTIPESPVFTVPPAKTGVFPDESIVLTAVCSSTSDLTVPIQWFKVGTPDVEITEADPDVSIEENTAGELTTSTLTIAHALVAREGSYYARATNIGGSANSASATVAIKRLMAHYEFEGNTQDSSDDAMHGTIQSPNGTALTMAYGASVHANLGQAIVFDAAGQSNPANTTTPYVDLPNGFANFSQGLTISAWVNPNFSSTQGWNRIVQFGNGSNNANNSIYFTRVGTGTTLRFENDNTNPSNATSVTTPANGITSGTWQLLSVVVNTNATNNATIYRNGIAVATGTITLPNVVTRTNCFIGRSEWNNDYIYRGLMDDVRIYNYPRTADEIAQLYADVMGTFCRTRPAYDYDNNCVEDIGDLQMVADTWLDCGIYPPEACP